MWLDVLLNNLSDFVMLGRIPGTNVYLNYYTIMITIVTVISVLSIIKLSRMGRRIISSKLKTPHPDAVSI